MGVGSRAASMSLRTNGMPDPGARGGMPRQPFEEAQPETFCNSPPLPGAEKYMEILPFRAPALSPLEAHVFNLLCTRAQPWPIDVAGTPCALEAGGLAAPVPPVCAFDVVCGERTWRVELGSLRLLALHPAVADVPPNAALPGALQLAVLDLLAAPLAELAQTFLHVPLAVRNVRMIEAAEPAVCALPLTLHVPVGRGPPQRRIRSLSGCASRIGRARSNWWNVWTPCRAAAHWGLPGTCRFRSASKRGVCGFPSTSCLPLNQTMCCCRKPIRRVRAALRSASAPRRVPLRSPAPSRRAARPSFLS